MKLLISGATLAVAAVALTLTGCGDDQHPAYSAAVQYGQRQDPIVKDAPKLGEERFDPDRPGILPIMKLDDMLKPDHPYYAKKDTIDDKVMRDPTKVPDKYRKEIADLLLLRFGTPAKPTVNVKDLPEQAALEKAVSDLKLDDKTLAFGSTRYRVHCLHCHGVPGNGRGPTARWINPHPRDFRSGLFKFISTDTMATNGAARPPSRADLLRTLRRGIEGTAMPTFNLLPDEDLEALASYVIHLSLRGNSERETILLAFEDDKGALKLQDQANNEMKDNVDFLLPRDLNAWAESNKPTSTIKPAPYPYDEADPEYMKTILPASVKRGQQIFNAAIGDLFKSDIRDKIIADAKKKGTTLEEKDITPAVEAMVNKLSSAKCVTCHVDYGRQAKFRFDEWGTLARPNNFPQGVFRGGRRPIDIYNRIHSGIPGSLMTPFGDTFKNNENYIWDLVNFVSTLQIQAMREKFKLGID